MGFLDLLLCRFGFAVRVITYETSGAGVGVYGEVSGKFLQLAPVDLER